MEKYLNWKKSLGKYKINFLYCLCNYIFKEKIKEKYLFKFIFNLLHLTVPHLKFCKNNPGYWLCYLKKAPLILLSGALAAVPPVF